MNAVKLIDEKHSDMDELPVTFVGVKIGNLPSNRFLESMSLSNRVRSLELQMSEFLSTKTLYMRQLLCRVQPYLRLIRLCDPLIAM